MSKSLRLFTFERTEDGHGRIIAEIDMKKGRHNKCLESETPWTTDIDFLYWSTDLVHAPLSDYSASILDCATGQHPTILNSFALDVSSLS